MGVTVLIAVLAIFVVVVIVLAFIGLRNNLRREKNELGRALLSLDQLLKHRRDELPKLIGTCRSYLKEPDGLISAVTAARAAEQKAAQPPDKARAAAELQAALRDLFAAGDRDSALELNTSYRQLKKNILALDGQIATEQARFNLQVAAFNARIGGLPGNLVAGVAGLRPQARFEAGGK